MKWKVMEIVYFVHFLIKSMELLFFTDKFEGYAWIILKWKRIFLVVIL